MYIRLSTFLLLCTLLIACDGLIGYTSGDAQDGLVVDAETGEPIPDAFVIGKWSTRGYERAICFHLSMTRTDIEGKYHLPAWRKKSRFGSTNKTVVLHAYKSGYFQQYYDHGDARLRLKKIDVTPVEVEKRIGIIREASRQITCRSAGESNRNVLGFYKSLFEEASSLAGVDSFEDVVHLQTLVERIELGDDEANARYTIHLRALRNKVEEIGKQEPRVMLIENTDQKIRGPD